MTGLCIPAYRVEENAPSGRRFDDIHIGDAREPSPSALIARQVPALGALGCHRLIELDVVDRMFDDDFERTSLGDGSTSDHERCCRARQLKGNSPENPRQHARIFCSPLPNSGPSRPFLPTEDGLDKRSMRLECLCLLIMAFGRSKCPMTEERRSGPDMLRIGDGERRRRGVAKEVRIDRGAESLAGMFPGPDHKSPSPSRVIRRMIPTALFRSASTSGRIETQQWAVDIEIGMKGRQKVAWPLEFERHVRLGFGSGKEYQPAQVPPSRSGSSPAGWPAIFRPAQWRQRQERDHQAVAMQNGGLGPCSPDAISIRSRPSS